MADIIDLSEKKHEKTNKKYEVYDKESAEYFAFLNRLELKVKNGKELSSPMRISTKSLKE